MKWWLFSVIGFFLSSFYSVYSFSLTAPNLLYSSNPTYFKFQWFMWQTFFNDRPLLTMIYALFWIGFVGFYLFTTYYLAKNRLSFKKMLVILSLTAIPLVFSNNALSYDLFNYIFNARIVIKYQANPHTQVALDFPDDPWIRFMHNTHTPAPYGYGWTIISLLPYTLGFSKFLLTWFNFKLLSLISLIGLTWLYYILAKRHKLENWQLYLLLGNPLILIEVLSNSHNDLFMMVPALLALVLLQNKNLSIIKFICLAALLFFSISIKFATLALLPLFCIYLFFKQNKWINQNFYLFASFLMFFPLLTERSQQFHPWYLIWSLSFLPLVIQKNNLINRLWSITLVVFSITSLIRYLPYLHFGDYNVTILNQQKLITWIAIPFAFIIFIIIRKFHSSND